MSEPSCSLSLNSCTIHLEGPNYLYESFSHGSEGLVLTDVNAGYHKGESVQSGRVGWNPNGFLSTALCLWGWGRKDLRRAWSTNEGSVKLMFSLAHLLNQAELYLWHQWQVVLGIHKFPVKPSRNAEYLCKIVVLNLTSECKKIKKKNVLMFLQVVQEYYC